MYEVCFVRLTANHPFFFYPLTIPVAGVGGNLPNTLTAILKVQLLGRMLSCC